MWLIQVRSTSGVLLCPERALGPAGHELLVGGAESVGVHERERVWARAVAQEHASVVGCPECVAKQQRRSAAQSWIHHRACAVRTESPRGQIEHHVVLGE